MKRGSFVGMAVVVAALSTAAQADVLFNNFGTGDTYQTGIGMTIGATGNWEQGNGFVVSGGSYFLDNVVAAIGYVNGVNELTLTLYDDAAGAPGTALETAVLTNLPSFGSGDPPTTWNFSGTTALSNGGTYWLIASAQTGSWLAWNHNDQNDLGLTAWQTNAGGWNSSTQGTRGAMRVNGTLIPAPGVLAMLGIAGLASRRRRRA